MRYQSQELMKFKSYKNIAFHWMNYFYEFLTSSSRKDLFNRSIQLQN